MKTNIMQKQNEVLSGSILSKVILDHIRTTQTTKAVSYDGYDFSMTIIKPFLINGTKDLLPVFLFVPATCSLNMDRTSSLKMASELVIASGQAAVMINSVFSKNSGFSVFEIFAAMKWIFLHGDEVSLNGNKMAIVGAHLGANIATVLSLMALNNNCPKISLQVLIDPQFFSSKYTNVNIYTHSTFRAAQGEQDWLNMRNIYDLPLESKIKDLASSPPTLVQLSENTRNHCELEYYCMKLLHAGTDVTYISYDENDEDSGNSSPQKLNRSLIAHTAAELRKFG